MITKRNITFQYYLSFLAFISKKDCPNIKFETVKISHPCGYAKILILRKPGISPTSESTIVYN